MSPRNRPRAGGEKEERRGDAEMARHRDTPSEASVKGIPGLSSLISASSLHPSSLLRLPTLSAINHQLANYQPPSMTTSGNLHTTSGNRSHCRSGNQVGVSCPCNSNPRSCHLFVRKSVCTRGSVVRHGSNLKKRFFTFSFWSINSAHR